MARKTFARLSKLNTYLASLALPLAFTMPRTVSHVTGSRPSTLQAFALSACAAFPMAPGFALTSPCRMIRPKLGFGSNNPSKVHPRNNSLRRRSPQGLRLFFFYPSALFSRRSSLPASHRITPEFAAIPFLITPEFAAISY